MQLNENQSHRTTKNYGWIVKGESLPQSLHIILLEKNEVSTCMIRKEIKTK